MVEETLSSRGHIPEITFPWPSYADTHDRSGLALLPLRINDEFDVVHHRGFGEWNWQDVGAEQ